MTKVKFLTFSCLCLGIITSCGSFGRGDDSSVVQQKPIPKPAPGPKNPVKTPQPPLTKGVVCFSKTTIKADYGDQCPISDTVAVRKVFMRYGTGMPCRYSHTETSCL